MKPEIDALSTFVSIARLGGFRAAAKERGVSPSALSHQMAKLERELGVRLLARTTRAVSLTEAGARLLELVSPALEDIDRALDGLNNWRDKPFGRVRLTAPRIAAGTVLAQALPGFVQAYPDIALEISVADAFQDLAAAGFDAGIRLGEDLQPNLVAVAISEPVQMVVVAAPAFLAPRPVVCPEDLREHPCIGLRLLHSGQVYAWEFEGRGRKLSVQVSGPLLMDDQEMIVQAAVNGLGFAYTTLQYARPYLDSGGLVRVLQEWLPPVDGFFLYYPSRKNVPAALRALIEHLRVPTKPSSHALNLSYIGDC
jgi:DNA-binding transcriptional LysR family regulator